MPKHLVTLGAGTLMETHVTVNVKYGERIPRSRITHLDGLLSGDIPSLLQNRPELTGHHRVTISFYDVRRLGLSGTDLMLFLAHLNHRLAVEEELLALDRDQPEGMSDVFKEREALHRRPIRALPIAAVNSLYTSTDGKKLVPVLLWSNDGKNDRSFNLRQISGQGLEACECLIPAVQVAAKVHQR